MKSVLPPLIASGLVVFADEALSGHLIRPRVMIGGAIVAVVVSLMPVQVGSPLAWLVFVTVLIARGTSLFSHLGYGKAK